MYYDGLKNIIKCTKAKEEREKYKEELETLVQNTKETFYKEMQEKSTIGNISEIYDSEEPYKARGAFAQAWSVAEVFRIITKS